MKRLLIIVFLLSFCLCGTGFAKSKKEKAKEEKAQVQQTLKNFRNSAFNAGMRCLVNQFDERNFTNKPLDWAEMMNECQRRFGIQETTTIQRKEKKKK